MKKLLFAIVCCLSLSPALQATLISNEDVPVLRVAQRSEVLSGLRNPWSMAWLPDGRMLLTEREGKLRMIDKGKLIKSAVSGLPKVFAEGQGGLLDVLVHPEFEKNQLIFLSLALGSSDANYTAVLRARLVGNALKDVTTIYENPLKKSGGQHFGSRLAWDAKSGALLISIGDGGNPPLELKGKLMRDYAQDLQAGFGKLLRIDIDGKPMQEPLRADADARIYSYGHRNIQGLAQDSKTGIWFASEHGALGGDELNRIAIGANYGWPKVSHSKDYLSGEAISDKQEDTGLQAPIMVWQSAVAPSGLAVYRGQKFPMLDGAILSGSLVKQDVRVVMLDADGKVSQEKAIRFGQRVRDVRVSPDGLIYVLTDGESAKLFRLDPLPAEG
jgi:aldose sugar dehydrogenase